MITACFGLLASIHFLYRLQMVIMYVLSCGVVCLHEFTLRTPTDFQDSRQNKKDCVAPWIAIFDTE